MILRRGSKASVSKARVSSGTKTKSVMASTTRNALIKQDVSEWHWGGSLQKPRTAFGFICAVLQRRRAAGLPAVTVLSCDNLPLNGDLCKRSTLRFAAACDADLAAWIAAAATFPNSMVDRITPATEDAHRARLADEFGVRDAWPVVSERFAQWVV